MKNIITNSNQALLLMLLVGGVFMFGTFVYAQEDYGYSYYEPADSADYGYSYYEPADYGYSYYEPADYGYSYYEPADYGYSYYEPADYGYSYYEPADYGYSYYEPAAYGYSYYEPIGSYGAVYAYATPSYGSSYSYSYATPSYYSTPKVTVSSPKVSYTVVSAGTVGGTTITAPTKTVITKVEDKQKTVQYVFTPTCNIIATPGSINSNQTATLAWTSQNATSAYLTNQGSVLVSGSLSVNPSVTTTYTLTAYNSQGQAGNCQTTVYVNTVYQTPSCQITYALPGGGSQAHLSWTAQNATSATLSNVGSVATNGSYTVYPLGSTTYTLTVYNSQGQSANCQTIVYGGTTYYGQAPSCTLNANPSYIQNGGTSYLTWTSSNATSAWLSDGIGSAALSGSLSVRPEANRTYTLTVTDSQGRTNTCRASVHVSGSYISLTQIPYTGFDFGPVGNTLYWLLLILLAGGATYLVLFYRGGVVSLTRETLAMLVPAGAYQGNAGIRMTETIEPVIRDHRADVLDLPVRQSEPVRATRDAMSVVQSRDGEAPRIVITRN